MQKVDAQACVSLQGAMVESLTSGDSGEGGVVEVEGRGECRNDRHVLAIMDSKWNLSKGSRVDGKGKGMVEVVGSSSDRMASGSAALGEETRDEEVDVGPDDEVVTPSLTSSEVAGVGGSSSGNGKEVVDESGQPLDKSGVNSWSRRLSEVRYV